MFPEMVIFSEFGYFLCKILTEMLIWLLGNFWQKTCSKHAPNQFKDRFRTCFKKIDYFLINISGNTEKLLHHPNDLFLLQLNLLFLLSFQLF